jgi:hypothetical protein
MECDFNLLCYEFLNSKNYNYLKILFKHLKNKILLRYFLYVL